MTRPRRPTLRDRDEQRLAPLARSLDQAMESVDGVVQDLSQFADDVDSDRVLVGGVILEPIDENDSLVTHVEDGLVISQAASA